MSLPTHTRPRLCRMHRCLRRRQPRWCCAVGGTRWVRFMGRRAAQSWGRRAQRASFVW